MSSLFVFCLFCSLFFSTSVTCSHLASTCYISSIIIFFYSHFVAERQTLMHSEALTQTHTLDEVLRCVWVELLLMFLFLSLTIQYSFVLTVIHNDSWPPVFCRVCVCVRLSMCAVIDSRAVWKLASSNITTDIDSSFNRRTIEALLPVLVTMGQFAQFVPVSKWRSCGETQTCSKEPTSLRLQKLIRATFNRQKDVVDLLDLLWCDSGSGWRVKVESSL